MSDSEAEAERIAFLRSLVGGVSYDLFLAHDIDDAEIGARNKPLYDAIADLGGELGHRVFVPHRFVKFPGELGEMEPRDTYVLLNDLMVPQCRLFLAHLSPSSVSAGMMLGRAQLLRKEMIFFYEEGTRLESVAETEAMVSGTGGATDSEVLRSPRVFYHHDNPGQEYFPYPHLLGVVRFKSVNECVDKLRGKIKDYFA